MPFAAGMIHGKSATFVTEYRFGVVMDLFGQGGLS
jgi:hypothetical protein